MRGPRESRDDMLFKQFVMLKRHFGSCRQCQTAKKQKLPSELCWMGQRIMFDLAFRLDDLIRLRRQAFSSCDTYVFACPDIGKHGKAYAATALPMVVQGVQDRMF